MPYSKILVADDDALIRLELSTALKDLGFEVVASVSTGTEALDYAKRNRPDLCILDVHMPGLDGIAVAGELAGARICPVLLLTAYSDMDIVDRANRAGVMGFIVKPYRTEELLPTIRLTLSRYREMTALSNALEGLQTQVSTDRLLSQAQRILMLRENLTEREALRRLHAQSTSMGRDIQAVCEAIILTAELAHDLPNRR